MAACSSAMLRAAALRSNALSFADASSVLARARDLIGAEQVSVIEEDLAGRGAHRYP